MLAWQLPAGTVNCIQFTILFSLKASPPNHKGHTIIECAPLSSLPHRVCVLCEREDRMKHNDRDTFHYPCNRSTTKSCKGSKRSLQWDTIIHTSLWQDCNPMLNTTMGFFQHIHPPQYGEGEPSCSCKRTTTHGVSCAFPIRYLPFAQKKGSAFKGAR